MKMIMVVALVVLGALLGAPGQSALAHEELTAEVLERMKADGSLAGRIARVKRLRQHEMSPSLQQQAIYRMQRGALRARGMTDDEIAERLFGGGPMKAFPYSAQPELSSRGSVRTLTLMVDFEGDRAVQRLPGITPERVQENIYGDGTSIAQAFVPYESVRNYYRRASQGLLEIEGDVLGWHHFPQSRPEYLPRKGATDDEQLEYDNRALWKIISEAMDAYDASHDFAQYDNDNDGDIDLVTILYAGETTGWGSFWWAYQWSFFIQESYQKRFDGKRVNQFVFQNVGVRREEDFDPKVLLHEMGHAFGLADYYDYEPKVGPPGGVGGLDMMHANWGNHNAFSRWLLDWVDPVEVGSGPPVTRTLIASGAVENRDKAIAVFPSLGATSAPGQEMFIIENRHRLGNDGGVAQLPSNGLVIWHVVATPKLSNDRFEMDNSYTKLKLIRLVRANSPRDFKYQEYANAGSYFNQGERFTPDSSPSSMGYGGNRTDIYMTDVSADGPVMTLRLGFGAPLNPSMPAFAADPQMAVGLPKAFGPAAPSRVDLDRLDVLNRALANEPADRLAELWEEASQPLASDVGTATCQAGLSCRILLAQWARRDGPAAARAVAKLAPGRAREELNATVMGSWAENDPHGAAAWYLEPKDKSGLDGEEGLSIALGARFTDKLFEHLARVRPAVVLKALGQVQGQRELWGAIAALRAATPQGTESKDVLGQGLAHLEGAAADIYEAQCALEKTEATLSPGARAQLRSFLAAGGGGR